MKEGCPFKPFVFVVLLFAGGMTVPLYALEIPSQPDGYVTDQADLLSPSVTQALENQLAQFEKETGNQLIVAAFPSLNGGSIEDFSIRLADMWKIGQQEQDNGIILLIFKEDRRIRIEVGYGLEAVLPDVIAGHIIQQIVVPFFREGRFEEGVQAGVQALIETVQGNYESSGKYYQKQNGMPSSLDDPAVQEGLRLLFEIFLFILLILFLVDIGRYGAYRRGHRIYKSRYSFLEWWFRFGLLLFALHLLFRILFYAALMSRGGYYGGRSGFGGFSGGRGGSFGGGGASGRW